MSSSSEKTINAEQTLGAAFREDPEFDAARCAELAAKTGMSTPFVEAWFQGRQSAAREAERLAAERPDKDEDDRKVAKRINLTQWQISILVSAFDKDQLPDFEQRLKLSKQLNMTPRCIQVWFQNRRQRSKYKPEGANTHSRSSQWQLTPWQFAGHRPPAMPQDAPTMQQLPPNVLGKPLLSTQWPAQPQWSTLPQQPPQQLPQRPPMQVQVPPAQAQNSAQIPPLVQTPAAPSAPSPTAPRLAVVPPPSRQQQPPTVVVAPVQQHSAPNAPVAPKLLSSAPMQQSSPQSSSPPLPTAPAVVTGAPPVATTMVPPPMVTVVPQQQPPKDATEVPLQEMEHAPDTNHAQGEKAKDPKTNWKPMKFFDERGIIMQPKAKPQPKPPKQPKEPKEPKEPKPVKPREPREMKRAAMGLLKVRVKEPKALVMGVVVSESPPEMESRDEPEQTLEETYDEEMADGDEEHEQSPAKRPRHMLSHSITIEDGPLATGEAVGRGDGLRLLLACGITSA